MAKHDVMTTWERRALSWGEVVIGRSIFDEEIDWPAVRILQAPALGFGAMVPVGKTIMFSKWRAARDFAGAPLDDRGWFVHELAHVWQAAHGVFLASAKLHALGRKAYEYKPWPGAKFADFNIERQAEIARHLYLVREGVRAPALPPRAWLEEVWASRTPAHVVMPRRAA